MPKYQVTTDSGRVYEVEAPSPNVAWAMANQYEIENAPPPEPTGSDFFRGINVQGIKEAYGSSKAILGDVLRSEGLVESGLQTMAEAKAKQAETAKSTDSFTNAWEKGVGAVVTDWLPYILGQGVTYAGETMAFSGLGALAGTAAAPGPGTAGGLLVGAVNRNLIRAGIKKKAEEVAKKHGLDAAETFIRKEASKAIGANTGLLAQAALHGVGETGSRAIEEAGGIENLDYGTFAPAALAHTGLGFLGEKILMGAMRPAIKPTSAARTAEMSRTEAALRNVAAAGAKEVPVELGQTAAERFGASLPLTGDEATREYIDTAAAATVMPGVPATVGGLRARKEAQEMVKAEESRQRQEKQRSEALVAQRERMNNLREDLRSRFDIMGEREIDRMATSQRLQPEMRQAISASLQESLSALDTPEGITGILNNMEQTFPTASKEELKRLKRSLLEYRSKLQKQIKADTEKAATSAFTDAELDMFGTPVPTTERRGLDLPELGGRPDLMLTPSEPVQQQMALDINEPIQPYRISKEMLKSWGIPSAAISSKSVGEKLVGLDLNSPEDVATARSVLDEYAQRTKAVGAATAIENLPLMSQPTGQMEMSAEPTSGPEGLTGAGTRAREEEVAYQQYLAQRAKQQAERVKSPAQRAAEAREAQMKAEGRWTEADEAKAREEEAMWAAQAEQEFEFTPPGTQFELAAPESMPVRSQQRSQEAPEAQPTLDELLVDYRAAIDTKDTEAANTVQDYAKELYGGTAWKKAKYELIKRKQGQLFPRQGGTPTQAELAPSDQGTEQEAAVEQPTVEPGVGMDVRPIEPEARPSALEETPDAVQEPSPAEVPARAETEIGERVGREVPREEAPAQEVKGEKEVTPSQVDVAKIVRELSGISAIEQNSEVGKEARRHLNAAKKGDPTGIDAAQSFIKNYIGEIEAETRPTKAETRSTKKADAPVVDYEAILAAEGMPAEMESIGVETDEQYAERRKGERADRRSPLKPDMDLTFEGSTDLDTDIDTESRYSKASQSATKAANPHTVSTLKSAIDAAEGNGFADNLLATGNFEIITTDQAAGVLGVGNTRFSKATLPDTINVDGVDRPTTNSNGQPIAQTEDGLRNFWRWFGDSKVVDAEGRPLVVYHGTDKDFDAFDVSRAGEKDSGWYGVGLYTTADPETASAYSVYDEMRDGSPTTGANVLPVYVALRNPYIWPKDHPAGKNRAESAAITAELKSQGFDGVVVSNEYQAPEYAAFHEVVALSPTQIKSAIGNDGTFSPTNPDIRYSKDGRVLAFVKDGKVYLVADAIDQKTDSVPGLLRHEIGVHALRLNRDDAEFQSILRDLERMRDSGDGKVKAAFAAVPTDTQGNLVSEEALGYLVEKHPELSISKRFTAWLRNAIRNLAGKLKGAERMKFVQWANRLTPEDLVWMANKALKTAPERMRDARRGEVFSKSTLPAIGNIGTFDPNNPDIRYSKRPAQSATSIGSAIIEEAGLSRTEPAPATFEGKIKEVVSKASKPKSIAEAMFNKVMSSIDLAYPAQEALRKAQMEEFGEDNVKYASTIGMFSQAGHLNAVGGMALQKGGIKYDRKASMFEVDESYFSAEQLIKLQNEMAQNHGITFDQAREFTIRAWEGRRVNSLYKERDEKLRDADALAAAGKKKEARKIRDKWEDMDFHITRDQATKLEELYDAYPELKEITRVKNGIRSWVTDFMVSSGLWSKETAANLLDNADWVPFNREFDPDETASIETFSNVRSGLQATLNKPGYKGSTRDVADILDNFDQWVMYSLRTAMRNQTTKSAAAEFMKYGMAEPAGRNRKPGTENRRVKYYDDGVEQSVLFERPEIAAFFNSNQTSPKVSALLATFNSLFRKSIIGLPTFSIKQLIVDSQDAIIKSGLPPEFAMRIPKLAASEFLKLRQGKETEAHSALAKRGFAGAYTDIAAVRGEELRDSIGYHVKNDKQRGKIGEWLNKAELYGLKMAMHSDNAVRQALYLAAIESGMTETQAVNMAADFINFKRTISNDALRATAAYVPFFSAALSAVRSSLMALSGKGITPQARNDALKNYATNMAIVTAISVLWAMANEDDEEYKDMSPEQRARQWTLPGTGGFGIPRRVSVESIVPIFAEMTANQLNANAVDTTRLGVAARGLFLEAAMPIPEPIPAPVKTLVEQVSNYNSFTGDPIVGFTLGKQEAWKQYGANTSSAARLVGEAMNEAGLGDFWFASPTRIDHITRGLLGSVGSSALLLSNMVASNVGDRPSMSTKDMLASIPGLSVPAAKEFNQSDRNDFYDLAARLDKVAATARSLESEGRIEEYLSYREKNIEKLAMDKTVNRVMDQINKLRSKQKMVRESNMVGKEDELRRLREIEKRLIQNIRVKELRLAAGL